MFWRFNCKTSICPALYVILFAFVIISGGDISGWLRRLQIRWLWWWVCESLWLRWLFLAFPKITVGIKLNSKGPERYLITGNLRAQGNTKRRKFGLSKRQHPKSHSLRKKLSGRSAAVASSGPDYLLLVLCWPLLIALNNSYWYTYRQYSSPISRGGGRRLLCKKREDH